MVLVTGANGRIGNVLVKELIKKGIEVKALVRKTSDLKSLKGCNCEIVYGDILNIDELEKHFDGIETVFHLAGHINISFYDKNKTYNTNINGTKNIIDICLKKKINLIYTSSIHAFATQDKIITEESPLCIDTDEKRGIYDCSKALATKEILAAMGKGLRAIIVAPTGVIGPFDYEPSFFGAGMIQSIKSGLSYTVGGKYDYVDVRDVVNGMISAYLLKKYDNIYILSGEILDMKTYIKYLREFVGEKKFRPLRIIKQGLATFMGGIMGFFNRKSTITPYSISTLNSNCDISHEKATKDLGYNPMSLKKSLHDQYIWFKENGYL